MQHAELCRRSPHTTALSPSLLSLPLPSRVDIYDTEESVFRRFLSFLYGGSLDAVAMSTEELVELLAVADR